MLIDFPGIMTPFAKVKPGEFFVFFDGQDTPSFAMKIFAAADANRTAAVLSFSTRAHPSMTPPTVLKAAQSQNRDVLVLYNVIFRPTVDVSKLRRGLPNPNYPGPVIFAGGATFIRAWDGPGTIDVNLMTGAASSSNHQGSIWADDWVVVLSARTSELVLCERGKPVAAARTAA